MNIIKCLLISFILIGCGTIDNTPDQKWLEASQRMIKNGDYVISTTNANRVKLFTDWAMSNKYVVVVSDTDPVAGKTPGMYFITVTDINKVK